MAADVPPVVLDAARAVAFERAVEVSFQPEFWWAPTSTDIRKPRCFRVTARRFECAYRFTVEDTASGATLYEEHGALLVQRKRGVVRAWQRTPTRDGF